ncbi:MAG: chorismate mutase [Bacteroidota bacterium]
MKESNYRESDFNLNGLHTWFNNFSHPLIISGPCSAESYDQVMKTANALHDTGLVSVFRSGIWKPRTRPNGFEGRGEEALQWIVEAKERFGFLTTVEVATPAHVELCLKHGIDLLWIGARTSVNPFSIQELADTINGVDIPVLVKNPVNPDLNLWIGVLERFYKAGIKKLAAVHRGFTIFEKTPYRNAPLWEIPIELKRLFPELPVLCDPSHIAGNRELIPDVAQKAFLLDMNGLMVETHIDPANAMTDAAQQLTPQQLVQLIENLDIPDSSAHTPCKEIEVLRSKIDDCDFKLIQSLADRMELVKQIALLKKECKLPVLQVNRWNQILETRIKAAELKGMNREMIKKVLELIHAESISLQTRIIPRSENL